MPFTHQAARRYRIPQARNCVETDRIATRNGFREMGVDTVGMIFARGIFLDIAGRFCQHSRQN